MEADKIPEWDLSVIFSGFDDPAWSEMFNRFGNNIKKLDDSLKPDPASDTAGFPAALTEIVKLYNETGSIYEELFSYAYCRYSTNTSDSAAMAEINRIEETAVGFTTFQVRFRNYLAAAEELLLSAIEQNSYLKTVSGSFSVNSSNSAVCRCRPRWRNSPPTWPDRAPAHGNACRKHCRHPPLAIWDESTGETKTSVELRAMAFDPDEAIRKKAFEKELALWKSIETPMALCAERCEGSGATLSIPAAVTPSTPTAIDNAGAHTTRKPLIQCSAL